MLDGVRAPSTELAARQQIAFRRIDELIAGAQTRSVSAQRRYFLLQLATVLLAAITPCLIFLANDNPHNEILTWLQLFSPALAATAAGVSHILHWREDAVRFTNLAEDIRSQVWRFQTRTGEYSATLSVDEALNKLVLSVDRLNLKSVANWSSDLLATPQSQTDGPVPATADHAR
jgi:hypothetical protein